MLLKFILMKDKKTQQVETTEIWWFSSFSEKETRRSYWIQRQNHNIAISGLNGEKTYRGIFKKSTMSHYHGIVMFYKVNNHHVFPKITLGAVISVRVKVKWLGCSYSVLLNQVYLAPSEWCEGVGYKIISGYFLSFVELKILLLWILHTSRGGFWLTKNFTRRSFMMWYK